MALTHLSYQKKDWKFEIGCLCVDRFCIFRGVQNFSYDKRSRKLLYNFLFVDLPILFLLGTSANEGSLPGWLHQEFVDDCNAHPQDLHRARFTLICFLGYAGFLRISAVLNIRLRHLTFNPHMYNFSIDGSKPDRHWDFLYRYLTVGLYLLFECKM